MLLYVNDKEVIDTFHEDVNRLIANSLPGGSWKMVKYCFLIAWSLTTTKDYEQQCTENRHMHLPTDY